MTKQKFFDLLNWKFGQLDKDNFWDYDNPIPIAVKIDGEYFVLSNYNYLFGECDCCGNPRLERRMYELFETGIGYAYLWE